MEIWRSVPDWEGFYEVSDQGRIRSVDRTVTDSLGRQFRLKGKVLGARIGETGYREVKPSRNGKQDIHWKVHVIVALTFLGPRPDGMDVCHNDGDPLNNAVSNLRYDTRSENSLDTVRHGNNLNARKTPCKRGHEFTASNIYMYANGSRQCRTCAIMRSAEAYHKRARRQR